MNDEARIPNDETTWMSVETRQLAFASFLDWLATRKGRVEKSDWGEFAITQYLDEEMENMRRTVVRLGISWAYRDWPEFNCELVAGMDLFAGD